jgi:hypothetical protein
MERTLRIAGLLSLLWLMGGCASITQGTDQQITAKTEPSGAECEFTRDGETVGVVNPTPGTVTVSKSKDVIQVSCTKQGHQKAVRPLNSEFEGMTAGNALFGGLIGLGVDAATGAMNEYPNEIFVRLTPEEFSTETKQMSYFRKRRKEIKRKAEEAIAKVKENCGAPDEKEKCKKAIDKIKERRQERLAELRADQAEASVAGSS